MPLSVSGSSCGELGPDEVDQVDRRSPTMAGARVSRPFDAVAGMTGPFDHTRITTVTAAGVEVLLPGDVTLRIPHNPALGLRGKKPPGQRHGGGRYARSG